MVSVRNTNQDVLVVVADMSTVTSFVGHAIFLSSMTVHGVHAVIPG